MKLYLVRHGEAVEGSVNPDRPLTAKGRADVEGIAGAAAERIASLEVIWHSTKTRARETAQILAAYLRPARGLVERDDIADGPTGPVADDIESADADLMIVSHVPFLPRLTGRLLEGADDVRPVAFPAAGLACLEADDALNWTLAWTLNPDEL